MFKLTIQDQTQQPVGQVSFERGSYIIGRVEGCDIVLPSSSVSRKHAKLFVQNGRCYLEDLGSANGVIADGKRVVGRRDLGTASQIRIGDYYLYLEQQAPDLPQDHRVLQTVFIPKDSDHYKIVRIQDSFAGEEFILSETENTIGRTDENFILLSDPSISRHHAKIIREGDMYTAFDLGSSNGSTLNGKPLRAPTVLQPGDKIVFGHVAFIFAEGDQHIDQHMWAKSTSKASFNRIAISIMLVLVGIIIGGAILYALVSFKKESQKQTPDINVESPTEDPAQQTLSSKVDTLYQSAAKAQARSDWEQAKKYYEEIVAIAPDEDKAKDLLENAKIEKDALAKVEEGEELSEMGRHEQAKVILEEIPKDTKARERADQTLAHLNRTLAYKYKAQATKLLKKRTRRNLVKAYKLLKKATDLTPDDDSIQGKMSTVKRAMRKKRIKIPD